MIIIIILHFITLIIFCFYDFKNITKYILIILNLKNNYFKQFKKNKRVKRKRNDIKCTNIIKIENEFKNIIKDNPPQKKRFAQKKSLSTNTIKVEQDFSLKSLLNENSLRKNKKIESMKDNNKININIIPIKNFNYKKKDIISKNIIRKETNNKTNLLLNKKLKIKRSKVKKKINQINIALNDQELDSLKYEVAIEKDKRTFCQYYWSLLKKNNYYYLLFILLKIII